MELGDLVSFYRKQSGLTIDELADRSGVPKGTLNKIIGGITKAPTLDNMKSIARAVGKTLADFDDAPITTKKSPSLSDEALKIAQSYTILDERGKGAVKAILSYEGKTVSVESSPQEITEKETVISFPKAKRNSSGFMEIKTYDQPAAAGLGNYLDEPDYHIEQYPVSVFPSKADFGIIISGDSMEPRVHDGGTVFVQASPCIDSGKIGIFILNGQAYCKQLMVDHDKRQIRLVSLNKSYADIIVGELDNFRTVGRVLGQWTRGQAQDMFGW